MMKRLLLSVVLVLGAVLVARAEDVKANPKTMIYHPVKDVHYASCTKCVVMDEAKARAAGYRKCKSGFQKKDGGKK